MISYQLAFRFNPLEHRNERGEWAVNGGPAAVLGDPKTARHVVTLVPGVGSSSPEGRQAAIDRGRSLKARLDSEGRGTTAVVVWGYHAPGSVQAALSRSSADATAGRLKEFVNGMKKGNPDAHYTVIGHSYGSTVSGLATKHGMHPDDLVMVGSPGVTVAHASALGMHPVHVWAGAEKRDPIARAASALSADFHGNPDHNEFGAVRFAADSPGKEFPGWDHPGAHTDYFNPSSQALPNMAAIATGRYTGVTRAMDEARLIQAANSITGQLDLARWEGWRTERRGPHGEWERSATEALSIGHLLRAAATPLVGPPIEGQDHLEQVSKDETGKISAALTQAIGGKEDAWNGRVSIYPKSSKPGDLATMGWDGTMNVQDETARALADAVDHPDQPVQYPKAYMVMAHEMLHGVVPPGSEAANKAAYQDYGTAQLEEGFTQLGTAMHLPGILGSLGIRDRQIQQGGTMGQMAGALASSDSIAAGHGWGIYPEQTRAAQLFVQAVATAEGETDFTPGSSGYARTVQLADEINRQGASGKVGVMVSQLQAAGLPGDAAWVRSQFSGAGGHNPLDDLSNSLDLSWKDAWMHELRGRHGEWVKSEEAPGPGGLGGEGHDANLNDRILSEWRRAGDPAVKDNLNKASAEWNLRNKDPKAKDRATGLIKKASAAAMVAGDRDTGNRLWNLAMQTQASAGQDQDVQDLLPSIQENAQKASDAVERLIGGKTSSWNGKVGVFQAYRRIGILGSLEWDGTMVMQDIAAQHMKTDLVMHNEPVIDPDVHLVMEHEMIHAVTPPGVRKLDEWAYQDKATADIEEGFTQLGAVQHAADYFRQIGIGDRETSFLAPAPGGGAADNPEHVKAVADLTRGMRQLAGSLGAVDDEPHRKAMGALFAAATNAEQNDDFGPARAAIVQVRKVPGLSIKDQVAAQDLGPRYTAAATTTLSKHQTMAERATQLADPAAIANGESWPIYTQQTKDAQDWVQLIAKEEGAGELGPGTPGYDRAVQLADEINRQGASGKEKVMAAQMARALTTDPRLRADQQFMDRLEATISQDIHDEWTASEPGDKAVAAFAGARRSAVQQVQEAIRAMPVPVQISDAAVNAGIQAQLRGAA